MQVELLGHVQPLLMIGESHCLAFRDLLFRPVGGKQHFQCRVRYLASAPASTWSQGEVTNATFADALVAEGVLNTHLQPAFMAVDNAAVFIAGQPVMAPPMVFFGGDTELVRLVDMMGLRFDFELPDDPGYGTDRAKQPIPYAQVQQQIQRIVDPILATLRRLQGAQLTRLMMHCIPPRSTNDRKAAMFTGDVQVPASVRSKLVVLANRMLRAGCEEAGIAWIDTWPETSEGGYLKSEYELDGLHVNRKSAMVSLQKITATLYDRTAGSWNGERYRQLAAQALERAPVPAMDEQWNTMGCAIAQMSLDAVGALVRGLTPQLDTANTFARLDWAGWPRAGRPGVHLSAPSLDTLSVAHDLLAGGDAQALLSAGATCAYTVVSWRVITAGAGPLPALPLPPVARRALLQLSDGAISLGDSVPLEGSAPGLLVVYDPARCRPRIGSSMQLIEMVLIPRLESQPFRLVWAGLCDLPCDPFHYSVDGMLAAPPFHGAVFSVRAR